LHSREFNVRSPLLPSQSALFAKKGKAWRKSLLQAFMTPDDRVGVMEQTAVNTQKKAKRPVPTKAQLSVEAQAVYALEAMQKENKELSIKKQQLESQLTSVVQELSDKLAAKDSEINVLQSSVVETHEMFQRARDSVKEVKIAVETKDNEIETIAGKLEELERRWAMDKEEKEIEVLKVKSEYTERLAGEIETIAGKLDGFRADNENLKKENEGLKSVVEKKETAVRRTDATVRILESALTKAQGDFSLLQKEVEGMKRLMMENKSELSTMERERSSIRKVSTMLGAALVGKVSALLRLLLGLKKVESRA
jgi:chromosome segregation ATPase